MSFGGTSVSRFSVLCVGNGKISRRVQTVSVGAVLVLGAFSAIIAMPEVTSAYLPHAKIDIIGDGNFTVANGVVGGTGTPSDPYVIEGWEIDTEGGGVGIDISHTTAHFIIRDCYLFNGDSRFNRGILLTNVTNGQIMNVEVTQTGRAISISSSHGNTVTNNNLYDNYYGVYLGGDNNTVANNNATSGRWGIKVDNSMNNEILGNTLFNNIFGLEIASAGSKGNNVAYNDVISNSYIGEGFGIHLTGTGTNTIHHNNVTDNHRQAYDDSLNNWDDGYPSGGNCWSDHDGVDGYSGVNQDQLGKDGIVDSPYIIDSDSQDRYPIHNTAWGCGIEWSPTSLTPHGPIHINGDSEFTPANGVIGGSGQWNDPYVIDGWDIDASTADGINITGATADYIIQRVNIHGGAPSHYGIGLVYAANGRIENALITDNYIGIFIYRSAVSIVESEISSNLAEGIWVRDGTGWVERSNITSNGGSGYVSRWASYASAVIGSNVTSNGGAGIVADGGEVYILDNNVSLNSEDGIIVGSGRDPLVDDNTVLRNGGRGIYSYGASYVTITNNTVAHHGKCIQIDSYRNDVRENFVFNCTDGISAFMAEKSSITDNIIESKRYGINTDSIRSNVIAHNTISSTGLDIFLWYSKKNVISNNTMKGLGIGIDGYMMDEWNTHDIDALNTVNGKPVRYLANATGGTISSDSGQVILVNSTNVTVENQRISNVSAGILLAYSSNNTLASNVLSDNNIGIHLLEANDNVIRNNTLSSNNIGLSIGVSDPNIVYHNNFLNNTNQGSDGSYVNLWDAGYPMGGNYWSDYVGIDNCSGPNQDICPDPDGIGDTPYDVDSDSVDRYPLMDPHTMSPFPPSAPQNLQAVAGNQQANLTWDAPLDGGSPITNYRIYRGTTPGGETFLIEIGNVTKYTDTNLVNGQTYYYRVSAVNAMGEGPLSDETSVTPSSIHLPPTGFDAELSGKASENVTLSWTLSPDDGGGQDTVVGYAIYRNMTFDSDGLGYGLFTLLPKGTSVYVDTLSGEGNPNNYFYRICAVDSGSQASCSDIQAAKFTRSLSQGFNFVSIPLVLSDGTIEAVLQNVNFERAWSYDSMQGEWSSYVKSKPYKGDFDAFDHSMGYWVDVVKESNLTVAGVVPLFTTIQLKAGLNLIGLPSFSSTITVGDLKAATGATRVEGLDPSNPPFFTKPLADSLVLQPGYGYWVMVKIDATWTIDNR